MLEVLYLKSDIKVWQKLWLYVTLAVITSLYTNSIDFRIRDFVQRFPRNEKLVET